MSTARACIGTETEGTGGPAGGDNTWRRMASGLAAVANLITYLQIFRRLPVLGPDPPAVTP